MCFLWPLTSLPLVDRERGLVVVLLRTSQAFYDFASGFLRIADVIWGLESSRRGVHYGVHSYTPVKRESVPRIIVQKGRAVWNSLTVRSSHDVGVARRQLNVPCLIGCE